MFTGNKDTDYLILLRLSDEDLGKFCQLNRYTRNLCKNENLWKAKLLKKFGVIFTNRDLERFMKEESWRNFYIRLVDFLQYAYNLEGFEDDLYHIDGHADDRFWKDRENKNYRNDDGYKNGIRELKNHIYEETNNFFESAKNQNQEDVLKDFVGNDFINPTVLERLVNWFDGSIGTDLGVTLVKEILATKDEKITPRLINYLFKNIPYHVLEIEIAKLLISDSRFDPNINLSYYVMSEVLNICVSEEILKMVLDDKRIKLEPLLKAIKWGIGNYMSNINVLQSYLNKLKDMGADKEIFINLSTENEIQFNKDDTIDDLIRKILEFNLNL